MFAQQAARILVKGFDIIGHILAANDTEVFKQLKRKPACEARQCFVIFHRQKRLERRGDFSVNEMLKTALHFINDILAGQIINKCHDARTIWILRGDNFAHGIGAPH